MIIHISIPRFWIAVEELRRPEIQDRPVVIGSGFLEKTAAGSKVLMANGIAEEHGVYAGLSLAQVYHLCPEAIILSPEMAFYREVRDEIMALLLSYTPLVEWIEGGEATCDVRGCDRLFGPPVQLATEIVLRIDQAAALQAVAGVGSNRLVAQMAARQASQSVFRVVSVEQGEEATFLAPLPIATLPGIDPDTLLTFKVLGLKTFGDVSSLSIRSLERRFGPAGKLLGQYARGQDDRPVRPAPQEAAIQVNRSCDVDFGEIDPRQALSLITGELAADLAAELYRRGEAGRLLILTLRIPRNSKIDRSGSENWPHNVLPIAPAQAGAARSPEPQPAEWFPSQEARIHSMLPQPKSERKQKAKPNIAAKQADVEEIIVGHPEPESGSIILASSRMATSDPIREERPLREIVQRLLGRMLRSVEARAVIAQPGSELRLEMRQLAPPEQLRLFKPQGHDRSDPRWGRLRRQEVLLKSRFGATPFRHLTAVDLNGILEERRFRWGDGIQ